jgi:hypothetical protein
VVAPAINLRTGETLRLVLLLSLLVRVDEMIERRISPSLGPKLSKNSKLLCG